MSSARHQQENSHLHALRELNPVWSAISVEDRRMADEMAQRFAPDRGIVVYDNEEDDADTKLDHYDMPPLSDEDCEALFADLPMGS